MTPSLASFGVSRNSALITRYRRRRRCCYSRNL